MGKRILLADDSITIQKVIELTFSDEDFEVVTVGNGRLAIERLEEVNPDIVLCDIIMPEKDGYEVCDHIKKHPTLSRVPVLLLTGAFEPFDQERATRVGCDGFLAKPFEPSMLIGKVKDLLAQAGSRSGAAAASPAPAAVPEAAPVPRFEPVPAVGPSPGPAASFISDSADEPMIEEFPAVVPLDEAMPQPQEQEEAASALERELYGEPGGDGFSGPAVTAEEAQTLSELPAADTSSSTMMFRADDVHWPPPPEDASPAGPAVAPPADPVPAFDEVFEAELQAGVSDAPEDVSTESFGSTIPFTSHVEAAASEPEPDPVFEMALGSEPAREVAAFEPAAVVTTVAPPAPPDLPEEVSFAEVTPAPAAKPVAAPSAAAEVAVPVDMVAQIAQRVVSQISEKMVREVAWEVIPDLAETLIKKEIERLRAELQNT
jgi:CheY-like chemotaxis protein